MIPSIVQDFSELWQSFPLRRTAADWAPGSFVARNLLCVSEEADKKNCSKSTEFKCGFIGLCRPLFL